jgi:outer membrane receptor protein involved in Fe transport
MPVRLLASTPLVVTALCCAATAAQAGAPAEEKRSYNLPKGDAATTLNQFAGASGRHIVFMMHKVRGEQTNAIAGAYSAQEALQRMLAGTALVAMQDPATGAFVVSRRRAADTPGQSGEAKPETSQPPKNTVHSDPVKKPRAMVRVAAWLSLLVSTAEAQTAPAAGTKPAEEAIVLSPFEVNTTADLGYTATSALAGGRIETPLKFTPSAITMLTREFLDDIAATNFTQAAEWAPNTMPAHHFTNFGEYNVDLRSIGSSFPSRNYFRWYIDSDSYNTERLEFARGPNSILFGDGNVGGVSTTWTKRAIFKPVRSLQLRTTSWGGYRASFDVNQSAGNRFAVRLNALHDRSNGWKDGDEPERDGLHAATTFKLTDNTHFRAEGETGRYRRFVSAHNFVDQSSNWDRTTTYNGVTAPSTNGTGVTRLNGGANDDFLVFDPSANLGVVNWRGFFRSTGTGLRLMPEGRAINRFPALPSREFSLQPPDADVITKYQTWTFYLEQRFTRNFHGQLAFNHQSQSRNANEGTWTDHRVDVNTVLPNGAPNPNFGKAFHDVNPTRQFQQNSLSDWRLSLAYKEDWRWLRENVSGIVGRRTDEFNLYTSRLARTNGTNPDAHASTNQVLVRQYWDRPINPPRPGSLNSQGYNIAYVPNNVTDEDQELIYAQISSSSAMFSDRLHVLLGYRHDRYDRSQARRIAGNPDGTPIIGGNNGAGTRDPLKLSRDTLSAGAVYYPIAAIGPFVNYSESFNAPGSGDPLINGRTPDPSMNEGYDVGIKFGLLENRISGSASYYRMKQVGRTRGGSNRTDINEIWTDLGRADLQIPNFRDLETFEGKGFELDLTANLTRSWRMLFNLAFPETEQIDIGPGLRSYYGANIDAWRSGSARLTAEGNATGAARVNQNIGDIERTIQGFTEGRALNNTVDYTANLYSTYSFIQGALKGFAVGGGANFRGKTVVSNVNNQPFTYLYADEYYLVSAHASYSCKIGKTRARFQVNVSNLLDNDDIVVRNYSFQSTLNADFVNEFRFQDPRKLTFSATFDF